MKTLAAFDFDGTLTYRDSFPFFLFYCFGFFKTFFLFLFELSAIIQFFLGRMDRQLLKERFITRFFQGMPYKEVEALGNAFAQEKLSRLLRPEAMDRLLWHQNQGHRCVLVSASLEVYLIPWGIKKGFQEVLASRLKLEKENQIAGTLEGVNCRRGEKVKRLIETFGPLENYVLYAYGDSEGDKELLEIADFSYYRTFS